MTKQRLHYFDMLKGIAIFMVAMGHVLTMCVRDIDRALVFKFIGEIHMPLFFFISGWFTLKVLPGGMLKRPDLRQRSLQLLVPMVVVSSHWIRYFPHSGLQSPLVSTFDCLWSNVWKNGYWFTLVLFEIMLVYSLVAPLLSRMRSVVAELGVIAAVWAVMLTVQCTVPAEVLDYGSLPLAFQFWPVFAIGAMAARHRDSFAAVTASGTWVTAATLIAAVLIYFICWSWEFPALTDENGLTMSIARSLFHICISIVGIAVVKPWSEAAFAPTASALTRGIADLWQLLGRKSLSIYLLHYFFLFPLWPCRQALIDMGLGFTPLVVFAAVVASAVVAVTLGANAVIERSPLLALLLTGAVPKRAKDVTINKNV